jgi:translation initiation factor 2-alpha kinase 4
MDEIVAGIPGISVSHVAFHLNHWNLLELILEFCGVKQSVRPQVKDILSELNIQNQTWFKLAKELRAQPIGLSPTALHVLAQFDFRDTPDNALAKIQALLGNSDCASRMEPIAAHIQKVVSYAKEIGVRSRMFVCPFSCAKHKFYQSGLMFQCIMNAKGRAVFAAGGRYDQLIVQHQPAGLTELSHCYAVGMSFGFDRLLHLVAQLQSRTNQAQKINTKPEPVEDLTLRRCDILVAALDGSSLGVVRRIIDCLWKHQLSSTYLAIASSRDDALALAEKDNIDWVLLVKNEAAGEIEIRVHDRHTMQDTNVPMDSVAVHMAGEIQNRDRGRSGETSSKPRRRARA